MALSALGVGSGPDVQGIAQKLGAVSHQPRATLHARASHIGFQIGAHCTLEAAAASFREPAAGLVALMKFKGNPAVPVHPGTLSARANTSAAAGTQRFQVKQLAAAHRHATVEPWQSASEVMKSLGETRRFSAGQISLHVDLEGMSLNGHAISRAVDNSPVKATLARSDEEYWLAPHASRTNRDGDPSVGNQNGDIADLQMPNPGTTVPLVTGGGAAAPPTAVRGPQGAQWDHHVESNPGESAGIFKPHTDGATVGAVDFNAIDISGGAESALVVAKNARITQLGILATLRLLGDYRPIRLLDIEGANLSVTFDSQLDPWPWEFLFSLEAPKGSTAHSMDCPSEPLPNAGSGSVKGAGNGLSDYKISDPDAELELEGQFAVTRSSNSASDVTEGQRLEPERAGASIIGIGIGIDRSTAQCSAQAIAQSHCSLVCTSDKLGADALRGERPTLGGVSRKLRAVLSGRVDASAFSNALPHQRGRLHEAAAPGLLEPPCP